MPSILILKSDLGIFQYPHKLCIVGESLEEMLGFWQFLTILFCYCVFCPLRNLCFPKRKHNYRTPVSNINGKVGNMTIYYSMLRSSKNPARNLVENCNF